MSSAPRLFVATKAFIYNDKGQVLVLRESNKYADGTNAGAYDVPGGRVKPGENHIESLKREVMEETGLVVDVEAPFSTNEWSPTVRGELWQIIGIFYRCKPKSDQIKLSADHDDYKWIDPTRSVDEGVIRNIVNIFNKFKL